MRRRGDRLPLDLCPSAQRGWLSHPLVSPILGSSLSCCWCSVRRAACRPGPVFALPQPCSSKLLPCCRPAVGIAAAATFWYRFWTQRSLRRNHPLVSSSCDRSRCLRTPCWCCSGSLLRRTQVAGRPSGQHIGCPQAMLTASCKGLLCPQQWSAALQIVAIACLFLAGKTEDAPRSLRHITHIVYSLRFKHYPAHFSKLSNPVSCSTFVLQCYPCTRHDRMRDLPVPSC